jgi:hypothetical protein
VDRSRVYDEKPLAAAVHFSCAIPGYRDKNGNQNLITLHHNIALSEC